jgi:hypothetical protein
VTGRGMGIPHRVVRHPRRPPTVEIEMQTNEVRTGSATNVGTAALLAVLCALVAACGTSSAVAGKPVPKADAVGDSTSLGDVVDAGVDSGASDVGTDASGTDVATPPDGGDTSDAVDASLCPGSAGCPCSALAQCTTGFCIETPAGKQCAELCAGSCSNQDFKCVPITNAIGDVSNVCLPRYGKICDPCQSNEQCQAQNNGGARCVDQGTSGAFCGSACVADTDCPSDYACSDVKDVTGAAAKQCVVKAGGTCKCSEWAITQALTTTCSLASGDSKCVGQRSCLAKGLPGAPSEGGLSGCTAAVASVEICDGKDNDCNGITDDGGCDDGNPCTADSCKGASGCAHLAKAGLCDADGSKCTDDSCVAGKCQVGEAIKCDDGKFCTDDVCDPAVGCTTTDNNKPCDFDNTECTVNDACKNGTCQAGLPKSCDPGEACVTAACNKTSGKCVYNAKDDGAPCDDGNACTTSDGCGAIDATTSACKGTKIGCDDKNSCTSDSCSPITGCQHTPADGVACDDGDKCTENDGCLAGKCAGLAIDVTKVCGDKNPCTVDSCEPAVGCANSASATDGAACDDGNSCTAGDACLNGTCSSGKNGCKCVTDGDCAKQEDGNACNGTLYCDKSVPGQFLCVVDLTSVVKCDASVNGACQTNECDPSSGKCGVVKQPVWYACDADGSLCSAKDVCVDGKCTAGATLGCDDKNACTDDSCDPKKGCQYTVNTAPCDADGNACTQSDVCDSGACIAGKKKVCDDQEVCTKDVCDSATAQCSFTPIVQSCSDDNACTTGDTCGKDPGSGKQTCVPGNAVSCDDDNPCTVDGCDMAKGCTHAVDTSLKATCYSGDPKTAGKGECKPGVKACKSDGTYGSCVGSVVPGAKELCNGVDDTCDGTTDEGCKAGAFTSDFGVAVVTGTSTKFRTTTYVGSSSVGGQSAGVDKVATFGFYVWLKAFIGL